MWRLNVLQMDAMTALPKDCNCADRDKLIALKNGAIKMWMDNSKRLKEPMILKIDGVEYEVKAKPYARKGER